MRRLLLLVCVLSAASCGSDTNTTSTTPTTPSTPTITETFSGTLTKNGAASHPFATASAGTVTATLTTVDPDSAIVLGFSLGTASANACQISLANDHATQGTSVIANVTGPGNLCVRIYDVGNLAQSESYLIQVVHP
jgi:hypothetical protein